MSQTIKIRRAPASAYNPSRPISDLLKGQIAHLLETGRRYPGVSDLRDEAAAIKTEGDAAAFVARMTRRLHPEGYAADEVHPLARPEVTGREKGRKEKGKSEKRKKEEGRQKMEDGTDGEKEKRKKEKGRRKSAGGKAATRRKTPARRSRTRGPR
jgi:hypothetical protein